MTVVDVAAGVLLGLVAARVTAVLARRLWSVIVGILVVSADPGTRLPAWFWLAAELITGEDWRRPGQTIVRRKGPR